MINFDHESFTAADGAIIHYYTTPVIRATRGLVIVVHGMAEHAQRYRSLADNLYRENFACWALDQRGHGTTGRETGVYGHLADHDGWAKTAADVKQLLRLAREHYPDLPIYLFGHSMGSVVSRQVLIDEGPALSGAVLSGSPLGPGTLATKTGLQLAEREIKRLGPKGFSSLVAKLALGNNNKGIHPKRTEHDWLSLNEDNVDAYVSDPLCGFDCSVTFFRDLFQGLLGTSQSSDLARIPSPLPILILSGAEDPVTAKGKDAKTLGERLRKTGHEYTRVVIYPHLRHEILNEAKKKDVIQDIVDFLISIDKKQRPQFQRPRPIYIESRSIHENSLL